MAKLIIALIVMLLANSRLAAQIPSWYYLQCDSLEWSTADRIDDIYFFNRQTGFAASSNGTIHKTNDSGQTWKRKLKLPKDTGYFRSIEFSDDCRYGIAGSLSSQVFRSTDSGETWTDISAHIPDVGAQSKLICGLAHVDNRFYGVGWWGSNVAKFYRSNDAGETWSVQSIDPNLATSLVDITFTSPDICLVTGCRYYDGNKEESVVLRSVDTGHTWMKVFSDTVIGGRIWKIQFLDALHGVGSIEAFYHTDTVAYIKTSNGGLTWNIMNVAKAPAQGTFTQGIGFLNLQLGWIGGYYQGMYETLDSGKSWFYLPLGNKMNRYFRVDAGFMYASGDAVYVYKDYSVPVHTVAPAREPPNMLYPIYPNPAKGIINIEFDLRLRTNVRLELINLDTRKVYEVAQKYMPAGHYKYDVDCAQYPAGNYAIWLGTDDIPIVKKLVLLK